MYGSDRVLLNLARALLASGKFHPVIVLPSSGPLKEQLSSDGIEVHIGEVGKISRSTFSPLGLVALPWRLWQAVAALDRAVAGREVAVVHSNTLAVLSGAIWARLRRKKHVWHIHEIIVTPKMIGAIFPRIVDWLSDVAVSNSTMTEKWVTSVCPNLAARSRIVFNGLDGGKPPSQSEASSLRSTLGVDGTSLLITLVGRINRMKGQAVLLKAAGLLKQRGNADRLHFLFVGGPAPGLEDMPGQLKELAHSLGLMSQCHFLPFVSNVWPVWQATDIAVMPSSSPESFGLVAIEAMASGLPVIATRHGGALDIVVDGETGLLVPPSNVDALADAIARLASDPELRQRMGASGAERQRTIFSMHEQSRQMLEVYGEVLK